MVKPPATLSVLFTLQLVTSRYTTHGDAAFDVDTPISSQDVVVPDGYTPFPDIGVAYKYYDHNLTWNSARKHCITEGGRLAVIDSFKKKEYANSRVPGYSTRPFLGLHKLFDNSEWVSVSTGLSVEFVPWDGGSNLRDATRSCASLSTTGISPISCSARGAHICEIQLIPHNVTAGPWKPHGVQTQTPKTAIELPSGYTIYTHLGVAYRFYNNKIAWNQARKYCASHGANLAVIDSYEKVQHVVELRGARTANVFVGMHRLFDNVEWIDVRDGSTAGAIPWRNENFINEASRKCIALTTDGGDHGLYAGSCIDPKSFVCEVSIFKNDLFFQ